MNNLVTYEFTLVLDGVDDQTICLEDQLFKANCDDALVNFRNGTVYLDFSREAESFDGAVFSAIKAVESLPLNITVISILPDTLVNASDIAKRLHTTRQTISLWVKRERRQGHSFPKPVSKLSDKSPMWRWYEVVQWLQQVRLIEDQTLVDSAKFIENINAVLGERDPSIMQYRHVLLNKLGPIHTSKENNTRGN